MRGLDAILLGAVGDPRVPPGVLERDLLLRIRFELDQFVNLRPVIRFPGVQTLVPSHAEDDVNMIVIRENSEGLYSGVGGFHRKGTRHEVAVQSSVNTRHGVERIVRYAFEHAMRPERSTKSCACGLSGTLTGVAAAALTNSLTFVSIAFRKRSPMAKRYKTCRALPRPLRSLYIRKVCVLRAA